MTINQGLRAAETFGTILTAGEMEHHQDKNSAEKGGSVGNATPVNRNQYNQSCSVDSPGLMRDIVNRPACQLLFVRGVDISLLCQRLTVNLLLGSFNL